ncbi:putative inactive heme oxygenase 2, chloroplastic [Iris pallida]|uniref:Inactive heme oxygenase 2, chloroplastic n=1 Tax=Iris pallida TaxID=29817 RepID=A0AAX6DKF5_IRIPA|nr:putative inactive heme oxygenase 2, chloroplastic [Iris pallida]
MLWCGRTPSSSSSSSISLHLPLQLPPLSKSTPSSLSFNSRNRNIFCSISCSTTTSSSSTVAKKRKRYRRSYPGESKGIVEEMRFVAMRLRTTSTSSSSNPSDEDEGGGITTWRPSMEGLLKYLVDSGLVFQTLERIVDESSEVSYTYFRNSGLERSASITKDLKWFEQQGIVVPQPSAPGITYATYLEELAEKSAPSFLCHLYNIYFAHIAGGQGIGKQVCEMLLQGHDMEFYKWEGEVPELLKDVREKLNKLGEHWSRDEKNKCLREAAKSFRFSGQIVRLIIL